MVENKILTSYQKKRYYEEIEKTHNKMTIPSSIVSVIVLKLNKFHSPVKKQRLEE